MCKTLNLKSCMNLCWHSQIQKKIERASKKEREAKSSHGESEEEKEAPEEEGINSVAER